MSIFYVDPSKGSNGTGTITNPYNTWTGISFQPGNTYLQKRGTTWVAPAPTQGRTGAGIVFFFNNIGTTSTSFLTFGSYYNSDGTDDTTKPRPILDMNYNDMGFRFHDSPYNVVKNLDILHCGHSSVYCSTSGGLPTDVGYTTIQNCIIRENRPQDAYVDLPVQSITVGNPTTVTFAFPHNLYNRLVGLLNHSGTITTSITNGQIFTCTVTSPTTITLPVDTTGKTVTSPGYVTVESDGLYPWSGRGHLIENCEIYNCASDGIWGQSAEIIIRKCYIHDIAQSDQGGGDCLQLNGPCNNFLVENNVLDHSKRYCKQGFILSSASSGYGGVFRNNTIYDPDCSGTPIGISNPNGYGSFYCDQPGVICRNNTIIGGGKFMITTWGNDCVVEGNKLYVNYPNSCWFALYAASTGQRNRFTGNTVYVNAAFSSSGGSAATLDANNVIFSNNYLVNNVSQISTVTGINAWNSPRSGIIYTNNVVVGFPVGIRKNPGQNPVDKTNWIYNCSVPVTDNNFTPISADASTITSQPIFDLTGALVTNQLGTFSCYAVDSSSKTFPGVLPMGPRTDVKTRTSRTITNGRTLF